MRFFQWLLGGLTLAGLLYLIALNPHMTPFHFLPHDRAEAIELPFYVLIILIFVAGYLIGLFYYWLGSLSGRFHQGYEKRALEKRIKDLERELEETFEE